MSKSSIKNYFTEETKIVNIIPDRLLTTDEKQLEALALKISNESKVEKKYIYNKVNNWHKINGTYYYFKDFTYSEHGFFSELAGEYISNYFGLDTVHYKIATLKFVNQEEKSGIISQNFIEKNYSYKNLSQYISESNDLSFYEENLSILDKIRVICKSDEEFKNLQDDLKKMFIRAFYTSQGDLNGHNILFKYSDDGIRLAPLYDYEDAYIGYNNIHRHIYNIGELNVTDSNTIALFRNDLRFQELLYKLMDAKILSFLKMVEDNHKLYVPSDIKEHYKKYESRVKELVLKNKLIR